MSQKIGKKEDEPKHTTVFSSSSLYFIRETKTLPLKSED